MMMMIQDGGSPGCKSPTKTVFLFGLFSVFGVYLVGGVVGEHDDGARKSWQA
jgi:hypothetical protein